MGKPYASELSRLSETYSWSLTINLDGLASPLSVASQLPLLATGSGGSLTAAHLAADVHQRRTGIISRAATPLEVISALPIGRNQALLIISAGGRNKDIISVFNSTVVRELKRLIVICSNPDSKLAQLASRHHYVDLLTLTLPSGKDGFLATNSLLTFAVILIRGWAAALKIDNALPPGLEALICPHEPMERFLPDLENRCDVLWKRETLSVLYGPSTRIAAIDLESKFTEAALGSIQIADYRNFAHGRHHWLAKRAASTAVLAFITEEDRAIARKTLGLIPKEIPVVVLEIPYESERASLAALISGFHIAGFAGAARGIDPGRPGVPSFGSKIYHLPAFKSPRRAPKDITPSAAIAIERKVGTAIENISQRDLEFWRQAYDNFVERLSSTTFSGIVLDYDGTLCDERDRFTGVNAAIASELNRLLGAGMIVGIATGRGRSVRCDFRRIIKEPFWNRFLIGYYNAGEIGLLSDDGCPDGTKDTDTELMPIADALRSDGQLNELAECEYRRKQISIVPKLGVPFLTLLRLVNQIVERIGIAGIRTVTSTHSLDVLAPDVCKLKLVREVRTFIDHSRAPNVLCVGDRGQWPGNDFALLTEPLSLSVDEISQQPETCWNLSAPGFRGVQTTLEYLRAIHGKNGSFDLILNQRLVHERSSR